MHVHVLINARAEEGRGSVRFSTNLSFLFSARKAANPPLLLDENSGMCLSAEDSSGPHSSCFLLPFSPGKQFSRPIPTQERKKRERARERFGCPPSLPPEEKGGKEKERREKENTERQKKKQKQERKGIKKEKERKEKENGKRKESEQAPVGV